MVEWNTGMEYCNEYLDAKKPFKPLITVQQYMNVIQKGLMILK